MPGHCSHPEVPSRELLIARGRGEGEEGWGSLEVGHKAQPSSICAPSLQPSSPLLNPNRTSSTSKTLGSTSQALCSSNSALLPAEVPSMERTYRQGLLLPCKSKWRTEHSRSLLSLSMRKATAVLQSLDEE